MTSGGVSAAVQQKAPQLQLIQCMSRVSSSMAAVGPWNHHRRDPNKLESEENEVRDEYVCVPGSAGAVLQQADGRSCPAGS